MTCDDALNRAFARAYDWHFYNIGPQLPSAHLNEDGEIESIGTDEYRQALADWMYANYKIKCIDPDYDAWSRYQLVPECDELAVLFKLEWLQ